MSISPEIRDQAYQFFIEEVPELLEAIEGGLLTLKQSRCTATVHSMMRAAHSIKGGAASVELEPIKRLAHRLEDIFKAFYSETVVIDTDLEMLLLQAYDCLRLPLQAQIDRGSFDEEMALATAEPIFQALETRLAPAMEELDAFIPTSSDLGVDMVSVLFEVDVEQGIQRLQQALRQDEAALQQAELRAQIDVFSGFGEMLGLPGFSTIAQTCLQALDTPSTPINALLQLAIQDFSAARTQVLAGDRKTGGIPSPALLALASTTGVVLATPFPGKSLPDPVPSPADLALENSPSLEVDAPPCQGVQPQSSLDFSALDPVFELVEPLELSQPPVADPATACWQEAPLDWGLVELEISTTSPAVAQVLESWDLAADTAQADSAPEPEDWTNGGVGGSHLAPTLADSWDTWEAEPEWWPIGEDPFSEDNFAAAEHSVPLANNNASPEPSPAWQPLGTPMAFAPDLPRGDLPKDDAIAFDAIWAESAATQAADGDSGGRAETWAEPATTVHRIADPSATAPEWGPGSLPELVLEAAAEVEPVEPASFPLLLTLDTDAANLEVEALRLEAPEAAPLEATNASLNPMSRAMALEPGLTGPRAAPATRQRGAGSPVYRPDALAEAIQSVTEAFAQLPALEADSEPGAAAEVTVASAAAQPQAMAAAGPVPTATLETVKSTTRQASALSVRVDQNRLERMDSLVGELVINRNGLSLQNEQIQRAVRELVLKFNQFQRKIQQLRGLSDQLLVSPERQSRPTGPKPELGSHPSAPLPLDPLTSVHFDSLEMDQYGALYAQLQELLEQSLQLEESVGDVELFAGESNRQLEQQRQMLTQLRDELMWSRMLPLSGMLNRFPRVLREQSNAYHKPVNLKLSGTGVLVDKAVLEKLYDPLLHLLRNAFDHGIEAPEQRQQVGKPTMGQIEIRAYHQGNDTVIEVRDDGQGLNWEAIGHRGVEMGLVEAGQLAQMDKKRLADLIFEPGFSTASQVSEISGRGVGLDVVRSRLHTLKGKLSVTSTPGQGTLFTLRLPLTLTLAKLLVGMVGHTPIALPSDSIEEILIPRPQQIKQTAHQTFLFWREQLIPTYRLGDLLHYGCPPLDTRPGQALTGMLQTHQSTRPLLILRREAETVALELDQVVVEQEFVIKPFGGAIAPPPYAYGCTVLGDGSLVLVIDGMGLVRFSQGRTPAEPDLEALAPATAAPAVIPPTPPHAQTLLVVDDSAALRRTLALTLQKAGYRVLQAKDGREALEQLSQSQAIHAVICDIEMPTMNGFEFLGQRRLKPDLAQIPVLMLTSRSNAKHRQLAQHLGANQYVTKPYIEQEFLLTLRQLLHPTAALKPTVVPVS